MIQELGRFQKRDVALFFEQVATFVDWYLAFFTDPINGFNTIIESKKLCEEENLWDMAQSYERQIAELEKDFAHGFKERRKKIRNYELRLVNHGIHPNIVWEIQFFQLPEHLKERWWNDAEAQVP